MHESRARILVVDDDANLLDLLVDTLNGVGYQAVGVPDSVTALERLKKDEKYDLMISDIKMPGMGGIGLLKKVRRYYPRMPVLLITGYPSAEMIGRASADGFLAKPFRISRIEELIESTMAGKPERITGALRRIMVVDDDDSFREMLTDMLRANNYVPLSVSSADEALKELNNGDIDAVITDIRMPATDGITLMNKIKEKNPEMPVVLTTRFASHYEIDSDPTLASADGFLQKPFKAENIIGLLNQLSAAHAGKAG